MALYVGSTLSSSVRTFSVDDRSYELLWMCVGASLIGALYHPPRPQYSSSTAILNQLIAQLRGVICGTANTRSPCVNLVLAGDFNQLPHSAVVAHTGLTQLVHQPTHGQNVLDQVYMSNPLLYSVVRVVVSTVKSDHNAVVLYSECQPVPRVKSSSKKTFRKITPNQHAIFLEHISEITPVSYTHLTLPTKRIV